MNRLEAIEKAAGKKGNKLIAEFVFDVCVDRPERLATAEIIDRLEYLGVFVGKEVIHLFLRKYKEYGFTVGELPCKDDDLFDGLNYKPNEFKIESIEKLKGTW